MPCELFDLLYHGMGGLRTVKLYGTLCKNVQYGRTDGRTDVADGIFAVMIFYRYFKF